MLVVSRKKGTRIVAGDIEFSIVGISGSCVRVGIRAPKDVQVFRGELLDEHGRPRDGVASEEFEMERDA